MRRPLVLALAAACAGALPARAQAPSSPVLDRPATYWAVNVGAALASAWLQSLGTRLNLPRVLAAGAVGGSLVYAGQRVVGGHDIRMRLAGLELAAVGASMTGNIARGQAPLAELTLPLFPLYLRVSTSPRLSLRVRLSALAVVSTLRLAGTYGRVPDLGQSLVSGAAVIPVERESLCCRESDGVSCVAEVTGQHLFGAVAYATRGEACLCHEFGHVVQDIREAVLFAVPASDYALAHTGAPGRWLGKYLVVEGALPLMLLNATVGERTLACASGSFYECEVNRLTRPRPVH